MHNIENKQIVWKFVQSLEPARIVHARCTKLQTEADIYAQVTMRFHTQQVKKWLNIEKLKLKIKNCTVA